MQDLKIVLIWEDKKANFNWIEQNYFNDLVGKQVDLVLLPEMFNTSFTMNVEQVSESMAGESISWLIFWAKKLNTKIGATLIIKENGGYYNRFVIVDDKGVDIYYNKRHLFRMADENKFFKAGDERIVYELNGWKILLQVCYDLRFPVYSRKLYDKKGHEYDAIIYLANWPTKRANVWHTLLQARAMENQAFVIGVNRVGKDGNEINYSGNSMVVDPWGNIENDLLDAKNVKMLVILKFDSLMSIREKFPAYQDSDVFLMINKH